MSACVLTPHEVTALRRLFEYGKQGASFTRNPSDKAPTAATIFTADMCEQMLLDLEQKTFDALGVKP